MNRKHFQPTLKLAFRQVIGRLGYRLRARAGSWGIDLFDDIDKMASCAGFRVVFDVGANRGQTAKKYLREFPSARIYSFEPGQEAFQSLSSVAAGDKSNRVVTTQAAVTARSGRLQLRCFADCAKNTTNFRLADKFHQEDIQTVECDAVSVDEFCGANTITRIDLLKIDVEGAEMEVLRGAANLLQSGSIGMVLFEHQAISPVAGEDNDSLTYLSRCNEYLRGKGYRFVTMYTDGVHENEPSGTYNSLFVHSSLWGPAAPPVKNAGVQMAGGG